MTDITDFPEIISVENIESQNAAALFISSDLVFREEKDIMPIPLSDSVSYMPWGAGNNMPYEIIKRFEDDETLSVCAAFQTETVYAAGLRYIAPEGASFAREIKEFFLDNDMSAYFLGICHDIKMFEFAVSVITLSENGSSINGIFRKPACYCRFAPALDDGSIPYVLFANWRLAITSPEQCEIIPVLDSRSVRSELRRLASAGCRKLAVITKIPSADSLYYPIPAYGSIFRGKWYNIKRLIAIAKEAKINNSAPIKYIIEISNRYWEELFRSHHITDPKQKNELVNQVKKEMIDFITGARNSGKALFAGFSLNPDGKELHDIKITKIEDDKEGGDWASDHAEAINMLCFAMRVHSNLVGSVPGKAQTNNSGSDKRELYTIAQALQTPYRDCLFHLHRIIIDFNRWIGTRVECPLLQLTTLDAHRDIQLSQSS